MPEGSDARRVTQEPRGRRGKCIARGCLSRPWWIKVHFALRDTAWSFAVAGYWSQKRKTPVMIPRSGYANVLSCSCAR
jgi:hypothetical protein